MKTVVQILVILFLCSCGTRHKESTRELSKTKFNLNIDTNHSFKSSFDFQHELRACKTSEYQNLQINYKGKPGDSLSIEQYGADGKLLQKTKIKGTGEASLNQSSGASQEQTTTKESSHSKEEGKASGHKEATGENSTATKANQISTWSFPWWLWLILIIVVTAALSRFWKRFLLWPFNINTNKNEG